MARKYLILFVAFSVLLAFGCAGLQRGYEKPVVNITSFKAVPSTGPIPQFEIGLHIINPNRTPLALKGIAYTIDLEGYEVITGVSNRLPVIEAYGEGHVLLTASVDLFSSIGLVSEMFRDKEKKRIAYSFNAKLDAGTWYPPIRVRQEGEVSLQK